MFPQCVEGGLGRDCTGYKIHSMDDTPSLTDTKDVAILLPREELNYSPCNVFNIKNIALHIDIIVSQKSGSWKSFFVGGGLSNDNS